MQIETKTVKAKDFQLGRNYQGIVTGEDEVYGSYESDNNYVKAIELWIKYPTYGNSIEMVRVVFWDHIDGEAVYNFQAGKEFIEIERESE